jgi:hypothetical protein
VGIIVIKSTGAIVDVDHITTLLAIQEFIKLLNPKFLFLFITHCDIKTPDK